jgi:hypothetical protein
MTTKSIISKLEKNGYSLSICMNGVCIAKKNQQTYSASSLNALIRKLFN